jgi:phytoene synthase
VSDDISRCAEIVRKGDPDRFLAAMTASGADRDALMVLYAFNVEVSRAPWVTTEPMIAEMRLQWWLDAVEEIYAGGSVRRHEVVTPLAQLAGARGVARGDLDGMIHARQWDIYKEPFADADALWRYFGDTGGGLMGVSVAALGGDARLGAEYGSACGVAAWLRAVPALEAAGRYPLVDGTIDGVMTLAADALGRLQAARQRLGKAPRPARAALRAGWLARPILRQVIREPGLVGAGGLGVSEAGKRLRLLGLSALDRF